MVFPERDTGNHNAPSGVCTVMLTSPSRLMMTYTGGFPPFSAPGSRLSAGAAVVG